MKSHTTVLALGISLTGATARAQTVSPDESNASQAVDTTTSTAPVTAEAEPTLPSDTDTNATAEASGKKSVEVRFVVKPEGVPMYLRSSSRDNDAQFEQSDKEHDRSSTSGDKVKKKRARLFTSDRYVCFDDCTTAIEPSNYQLVVQQGSNQPLVLPKVLDLTQPATVEVRYESASLEHQAGLIVMGVGLSISVSSVVTGVVLLGAGESGSSEKSVGGATLAGGAIGTIISLIVGGSLLGKEDTATVFVREPSTH